MRPFFCIIAVYLCVIAVCGCVRKKSVMAGTVQVTRDMLLKEHTSDEQAIATAADAARQLELRKGATVLFINSGHRYGTPQVLRQEMAKEFTLVPQTAVISDTTDAQRLRYLAATAGCDYIFFVEQNATVAEKPLPAQYFSWIPLVGWFGIPDRQLEADVQLSVMVVDTRTGASFIEASAPIQRNTTCLLATHRFQEINLESRASREAVQSLLARLRMRMK